MARYYEETALIEFVKQYTPHINGETTMKCVERAIREAPTADVVPKSEVEELKVRLELGQKAHESLKELYRIDIDALVEARRKTEVEVAREIFEEIEKHIIFNTYGIATISNKTFAELKKKYTEGEG